MSNVQVTIRISIIDFGYEFVIVNVCCVKVAPLRRFKKYFLAIIFFY